MTMTMLCSRRQLLLLLIVVVLTTTTTTLVYFQPSSLSFNDSYMLKGLLQLIYGQQERPILRFRLDETDPTKQTFKIIQITDLHLGENEDTDWGVAQDEHSYKMMDLVIDYEKPDFIVLTGDQVSANDCKHNATEYYRILGERLAKHNIPWAMIFGNHDDLDYEVPDSDKKIPAEHSRQDLLEVDQSFPLSLSQKGPKGLFGVSNYVLDVQSATSYNNTSSQEDSPAARIYFFDSGGGALPAAIEANQIDWFLRTNQENIPTLVFQHIPTLDFYYDEEKCSGTFNMRIYSVDRDAGLLQALSDAKNVHFLAVGHNHNNDFCCPFSDTIQICCGRKSGYGSYGGLDRGARVYELSLSSTQDNNSNQASYVFDWKTWVRLENGDIIHRWVPPPRSPSERRLP